MWQRHIYNCGKDTLIERVFHIYTCGKYTYINVEMTRSISVSCPQLNVSLPRLNMSKRHIFECLCHILFSNHSAQGHAATAPHLQWFGQAPSDKCWWCGTDERQTRHHLFTRCRRWFPEIRRLWQRVEKYCEWVPPGPPPPASSSETRAQRLRFSSF